MTRFLLIIPLIALPNLTGCESCRSLETAQKAPALQPLSQTVPIEVQESAMTGSTASIVETGTQIEDDRF